MTWGKLMENINEQFMVDVWAFDRHGKRVHPYRGVRGNKRGLFSVNFTNDTNKFVGMTDKELAKAIESGLFRDRGTIRMLPLDHRENAGRNAYAPLYFKNRSVKSY